MYGPDSNVSVVIQSVHPQKPPLFFILCHFIVAKNHAGPEAVSEKYVPFYGNKIGRCITSEQCPNRWAKMTRQIMREKFFSKIASTRLASQLWASFMVKTRHELS